jgi:hypothetical protein
LADWYVYQHDGDPLGPWSTDTVAEAILAGKLAPDVWVAAPGGPRWLRALDVPVIGRLVEGIPTKPKRRDSGLRLIPGAYTTEAGMPAFGSTMMIVKDDEVRLTDSEASAISSSVPTTRGMSPADDTAKLYGFAATESGDDPPTEPALPPSPPSPPSPPVTPIKAKDTTETPSSDRRRRRKNA